jgi:hypothetical protein
MHPVSAFILAVMYLGVIAVTTTVAGFFVGIAIPHDSDIVRSQVTIFFNVITTTAVPLNVIAIAYIGRWIGNRSRPFVGLAVAIGSLVVVKRQMVCLIMVSFLCLPLWRAV